MPYEAVTTNRNTRWMAGLSSDTKPALPVGDMGTMLMETDTGREFKWTGTIWVPSTGALDDLTHGQVVISEPHLLIHKGKVFHMSQKITGIAAAATVDFLFTVPALVFPHVHKMRASVSEGEVDILSFEAPTTTAAGGAIPVYNLNRNSTNTPDTVLTGGPTVTAVGTEIHNLWIPAMGTGIGNSAIGVADAEAGEEWILKQGEKYLHRLTNNSGNTITAWFEILWYEL